MEGIKPGEGTISYIRRQETEQGLRPLTYDSLKKVIEMLGKMPPPKRTWYASIGEIKYLLDVGGVKAFKLCASSYDEVMMGMASLDLLKEHGYEFGKEGS